jgi:TusA-related sulfurtransferase
MPSKSELDLVGIAWPVCLLKFKCALNDLGASDVMEVFARDPDVVESIVMIVERSGDTLMQRQKEGEIYRLSIEKIA